MKTESESTSKLYNLGEPRCEACDEIIQDCTRWVVGDDGKFYCEDHRGMAPEPADQEV